jgi:hypothetical protein
MENVDAKMRGRISCGVLVKISYLQGRIWFDAKLFKMGSVLSVAGRVRIPTMLFEDVLWLRMYGGRVL